MAWDNKKYEGIISGLLPGDEALLTEALNTFDIIDESRHLRKDGHLLVYLHVQAKNKEEYDNFFTRMMIGSVNPDSDEAEDNSERGAF